MTPDLTPRAFPPACRFLAITMVACLTTLAAGEAAAYVVYTSRSAWEVAMGGAFTTDGFAQPAQNAAAITFDSGIVSVHEDFNNFGGANQFEDANAISTAGRYQGRAMSGDKEVTWTFPHPVLGFAADWVSPTTLGLLTVSGNFDGTGIATIEFLDHIAAGTDGFLGIVGTAPFATVVFGTESTQQNEAFAADNLSFTATAVPAPGTLVLLVGGLAGLALRRSRPEPHAAH